MSVFFSRSPKRVHSPFSPWNSLNCRAPSGKARPSSSLLPADAVAGLRTSAAAAVAVLVRSALRLVFVGAQGVAVAVSGALLLVWAGERAVALPAATAMRSVRPEGIVKQV